MVVAKKTRGRQKIDIVKMQNEQNLQVTFSKRRAGLFKKASELCTLTGSEIALLVFSPGDKAYSFGNPSVNAIIERFESQNLMQVDPTNLLLEAHRNINVQHLNKELTILQNQLDTEKKRGETLNQLSKVGHVSCWWEAPIEELNLEQLEQLHLALLGLQKNVKSEMQKITVRENTRLINPNFQGNNPHGIGLFDINAKENGTSIFELFQSSPLGTTAFVASAGSSWMNTGFSNVNGAAKVSTGKNGSTASVAFNLNASEFDRTDMSSCAPQEFNYGCGGLQFF